MNSSRTSTLTKQYCKAKNDCIRKMMISELQKGHRAATDLLLLPASRDSAIDLTDTIINSFSNSLSMLSDQSEPQPQPQPQLRSGDGDSNNIIIAPKSRRGCYRRRKTGQTREVVTPSFAADRYAWRKYGQKTILNSPYPRQYYRCTHKTEQGCQATKWVQRVSDHETSSILSSSLSSSAAAAAASSSSSSSSSAVALYRTLYEGEHTCKTSPPQIGSADLDNINNYILLGNSPPSTPLVVQVQVPPSSANSASDYNLYLNFGDPASTTINVPSTGTNITASTAIDTNNNNQYYHSSCGSGGGTHEDCLFFSSSSISLAGGDHHHHEMLATTTSSSINTTIHYDNIFPTINNTIGDVISAKLEPAASGSPLISNYHHAATDDYSIMAAAQISSDDYFDGIFDVDLSPL